MTLQDLIAKLLPQFKFFDINYRHGDLTLQYFVTPNNGVTKTITLEIQQNVNGADFDVNLYVNDTFKQVFVSVDAERIIREMPKQ